MQIPKQSFLPGNVPTSAPGVSRHMESARPKAEETGVDAATLQSVLSKSYAMLERRVQSTLSSRDTQGAPAPAEKPAADDFSPAAVSGRIMDFITQRLEVERANGASEERLASLYNQATKGLAQGFGEAAKIIDANGLFEGKVKDDFFATISNVEKAMGDLKKDLFGDAGRIEPPAADTGVVRAAVLEAQASQSRSFNMQITTQEGDVIDLQVSASQRYGFQLAQASSDGVSLQSVAASQESERYFSFSVQGDLNEEELASINALFSEVNDVADAFFAGRVDEAFDQALSIGLDSEQLAGFAVNMSRTDVVAARQAYSQSGAPRSEGAGSDRDEMFKTLSDFASRVKKADVKLDQSINLFDTKPVLAELLAQLKPQADSIAPAKATAAEPAADPQSQLPEQASPVAQKQVSGADAFREFVSRLLG